MQFQFRNATLESDLSRGVMNCDRNLGERVSRPSTLEVFEEIEALRYSLVPPNVWICNTF